jgi:hypothetical protein
VGDEKPLCRFVAGKVGKRFSPRSAAASLGRRRD